MTNNHHKANTKYLKCVAAMESTKLTTSQELQKWHNGKEKDKW